MLAQAGSRSRSSWHRLRHVEQTRAGENDSMIGSVLLPTSPYRARSERLIRASEAACARIHPLTDNVFPSLGETLVWLVAIDDLLSSADSKCQARRCARCGTSRDVRARRGSIHEVGSACIHRAHAQADEVSERTGAVLRRARCRTRRLVAVEPRVGISAEMQRPSRRTPV